MHDGENIEMRPNGGGQTASNTLTFVKVGAEVGVHLSRHSSDSPASPGNSVCMVVSSLRLSECQLILRKHKARASESLSLDGVRSPAIWGALREESLGEMPLNGRPSCGGVQRPSVGYVSGE
jgi:hypothetical protein